jgi:hypothetical protein
MIAKLRRGPGAAPPLRTLFLVVLTVIGGLGLGLGTGLGLGHAGAPALRATGPATGATPSARVAPAHPGTLAARPGATPTCQDAANYYDAYNSVAGTGVTYYPLYPNPAYQSPCLLTGLDGNIGGVLNDEVHATFGSNVAGSGKQFTVPLRLPAGNITDQVQMVNDYYADMVVTGNPNSVDNQSLLQVLFFPTNHSKSYVTDFNATIQILSLYDTGSCGGTGIPADGLDLSWNGANACEAYDTGLGIPLATDIPGGNYVNVTFDGAASSGVVVYLNDSTSGSYSSSKTMNTATTGVATYTPYFDAACPDRCLLNWSMPFGNGFGADLAATGMNSTIQAGSNPIWIGSPEYFTGSGYTGDYADLSTESGSGGCSSVNPGSVIPCPSSLITNFVYPYFQANGTWLNFGAGFDYNWTTRDFGGVVYEFPSGGQMYDYNPMQLDHIANSSQVGFLLPNTDLNVTVRAQDLGRGESLNLTYILPGSSPSTIAMGLYSGNRTIGQWGADIPSGGGSGTISYWINATSDAGTTQRLPVNPKVDFRVQRVASSLPSFNVTFITNPANQGYIEFGGLKYSSYQHALLTANAYTMQALPSRSYDFLSWSVFGAGLSLPYADRTVSPTNLNLTGNGSITANLVYVRPHDTIQVAIDTNGCGSVTLNRTLYTMNATVELLDGLAFPLSYGGCAQNDFAGWVPTPLGNLSVVVTPNGTTLTPHGNGTLSLTFLPITSSPVSLSFATVPQGCGGVLYEGAQYDTGTTVSIAPSTPEAIAPAPCTDWGFESWNTTLGITISSGTVTAVASGQITANYYPLTIVTVYTYPAGCGYVTINSVAFYNGQYDIVQNNSRPAIEAYPCTGYYFAGWHPTGSVYITGAAQSYEAFLTILGSGTITAAFQLGTPTYFVAFITNPANCGSIDFDGRSYVGSDFIKVPADSLATISAVSGNCNGGAPYGFVGWTIAEVGINLACLNCSATTAWINASGSIQANFHPLTSVYFNTAPTTCGTISIDGNAFASGTVLNLPAPGTFTISAKACPHYYLAGWATTQGAQVYPANYTLILESGAVITAEFKPSFYVVSIGVSTGTQGEVQITAAGSSDQYGDGAQWGTPYGAYPLLAIPPTGFSLIRWATSGGVSVGSNLSANTTLYVNGSGTLSATYEPAFPIVDLAAPPTALSNSGVTFTANVTNPVPSSSYLFTWSFGDSSNATTTASGTVTHDYPYPGIYTVTVKVTDSYHRTASANASVRVVLPSSTSLATIGPVGFAVIGIAGVVVVAAVLLGRRRSAAEAPAPSAEPATPKA